MKELLNNKTFVIFWLSQSISQIGNTFHLIALPLWVLDLTNSAFQTGLVATLELISGLVFALFGGILSDRLNQKVLICISDFVRGTLVVSLIFINDPSQIWFVYLIAIASGMMTSLFVPAQTAIIQYIVKKEDYSKANSLVMLTRSIAMILGPIIGGIVVQFFSFKGTFCINASSYLIGVIGALLIKYTQIKKDLEIKRSIITEIQDSFQLIRKNSELKILFISVFAVFLGTGANGTLFILHLTKNGVSPDGIGFYMATQGFGMILASLLFIKVFKEISKIKLVLFFSNIILGITLIIFIQTSPFYFLISLIALFLFGLTLTFFTVSFQTILQTATPSTFIGKISGLLRIITTSATGISILLGTTLCSITSAKNVVTIFGLIVTLTTFWCIPLVIDSKRNQEIDV